MATALAVVALAAAASPAFAQMGMGRGYGAGAYGNGGQDTIGLSFTDIGPSGVHSPAPGTNGTLQSEETRAFALIPVAGKGTDTVWSAGVSGEHLDLHFNGFSPALAPLLVQDLYGGALLGNVFHRVDDRWSWLAYAAFGRFSNEWPQTIRSRTSGGGIVELQATSTLRVGVGGGFTYVFGEPRAVPILSLAYRDGPWAADVRFPFRADASYAVAERLRVGAEYFVQGGEFSVVDSDTINTVRYTSQLAGLLLSLGPYDGLRFQLDAGTTVYRHYAALEDTSTVYSASFKDSWYSRAGVTWRF
jgi:hypothetical protein